MADDNKKNKTTRAKKTFGNTIPKPKNSLSPKTNIDKKKK